MLAEASEQSRSERTVPCGNTITELFERQVTGTPKAVAVVCGDRSLTYRELDCCSNQLARHLVSLGAGREVLVGLATGRSLEMIVGLLAILKSGAAYVPIDPSYPPQRIALMIDDSQSPVILTTEHTKSRLPSRVPRIVSIDGDASTIMGYSADPFPLAAGEENLAYVIYTSGSTGRPKGVMIEHRNVVNVFNGMDQSIGSEPGVWLAVTSISFDISVLELFWTLTRGFQVIIHGDEGTHTIADEIRKYGVTHMQATPSLVRMVATNPEGLAALGLLKKMFVGGELLPASLVRQVRQRFSGEMYNMYGPTETTIWSTTYKLKSEDERIPIGKPIVNTQTYVLNSEMRPIPTGESGDLFIGGDGVVRGYWRNPELTAERFLSDPFLQGNRIYRTGDVARFLPDGNLEFLGRADFQVKVRGFRIEIGEIEAALDKQPGVSQSAVVAPEFKPGDQRLIAYIVSKSEVQLKPNALRGVLASQLPEYMVPSLFVQLSSFPLTANGKIDRKALTERALDETASTSPSELPRTELESVIAQAWKNALGIEYVGLDQNFFDLGAHSLMVAEVHMQLQQVLDREISLVDLFQYPTVIALSAHLGGAQNAPETRNRAERRLAARKQRTQ